LLKREAQAASTIGYAGACLIDDALISFRFSLDMSSAARVSLAHTLCETVTRAYGRLGLTVAPDKTLVSMHVFHFLNRFFAEGSEIMLPLRTIMKVGADPFALIRSFRGQIDELSSTVRRAVAKGADPTLLYCLYAIECCRVAYRLLQCSSPTINSNAQIIIERQLGTHSSTKILLHSRHSEKPCVLWRLTPTYRMF
jgi:Mononegavirales RNA dependent RNA polymerase